MNIGKRVRLNRLFAHPSGRMCSLAVDHLVAYGRGLPPGLRHIAATLEAAVSAKPDAVTMHKGLATSLWEPYAGRVPFILQSTLMRIDDSAHEYIATPEDAVRLGADAFAVAAFVNGATEASFLRAIADFVEQAQRYDMPVICHIYPRSFGEGEPTISYASDDIAWAVRCALEMGADVIKAPFCGDIAAQAQIVADCPVPFVAAGGPKTGTLEEALNSMAGAMASGMRGATIGRNIWGNPDVALAVRAFAAVVHDGFTAEQALVAAQA
ncbi:MAG: aldolase [Chloroflexi bacterium]|nr:aldolase [Chloroflexota bacterium]